MATSQRSLRMGLVALSEDAREVCCEVEGCAAWSEVGSKSGLGLVV